MTILALDPGSSKCGVAAFDDGELASAWLVVAPGWKQLADAVATTWGERYPFAPAIVVFEKMKIYNNAESRKGDQGDLVDLSLMAGRLTGLFYAATTTSYLPREWKGTTPKNVMFNRILGRLSEEEKSRIEMPGDKKKKLDVVDAIGIGLKFSRRL